VPAAATAVPAAGRGALRTARGAGGAATAATAVPAAGRGAQFPAAPWPAYLCARLAPPTANRARPETCVQRQTRQTGAECFVSQWKLLISPPISPTIELVIFLIVINCPPVPALPAAGRSRKAFCQGAGESKDRSGSCARARPPRTIVRAKTCGHNRNVNASRKAGTCGRYRRRTQEQLVHVRGRETAGRNLP
jgi:hypothetical protein